MELSFVVANQSKAEAVRSIKEAERSLGKISGTSHIKSRFSRVRRALGRRNPNSDKMANDFAEGMKRYRSEISWRRRAQADLAMSLKEYDHSIRDTIGLRSQERLTGDQADAIAGCQSIHRDISLNF